MPLRPHQIDAMDAMVKHSKGQIIVPTGGGKTMCMIEDAVAYLKGLTAKTVVVVAPRILLAEQLCSEFLEVIENVSVMHVHSGETSHYSSTKLEDVYWWHKSCKGNKIIFTTYHSLDKVMRSTIDVDTIYFDEAHNSVQKNFFPSVKHFSNWSKRSYFFTATPKHSLTPFKAGMNDSKVYGNVICQVPAPKLVKEGYILPPKVEVYESRLLDKHELVADKDCEQMIDSIDNLQKSKVLICAKSTKQITNLVSQTDFCCQLRERGYNWMYITAKTGAFINGKKVKRDKFFEVLNQWGRDDYTKFVICLVDLAHINTLSFFKLSMEFIICSQSLSATNSCFLSKRDSYTSTFGGKIYPSFTNLGAGTWHITLPNMSLSFIPALKGVLLCFGVAVKK